MSEKEYTVPNEVATSTPYQTGQVLGYNIRTAAEINQQYELISSNYQKADSANVDTELLKHGFI